MLTINKEEEVLQHALIYIKTYKRRNLSKRFIVTAATACRYLTLDALNVHNFFQAALGVRRREKKIGTYMNPTTYAATAAIAPLKRT